MMSKLFKPEIKFFFSYLSKNAFGYLILEVISCILLEFMSVLNNVLLYYWIIDALVNRNDYFRVLYISVAVIFFTLGQDLFYAWYTQKYKPIAQENLRSKLRQDIYKRTANMDMANYDDPAFYNDVVLCMESADVTLDKALCEFAQIIACIVSIMITGGLFLSIDWKLCLFVIFSLAITFFLDSPIANIDHQRKEESVPYERRRDYFAKVFYGIDFAKELRLYDIYSVLVKRYQESSFNLRNVAKRYGRKKQLLKFLQTYIPRYLLLNFFLLAYLAYKALVQKSLSLSEFVATFNGVSTAATTLSFLLGTLLTEYQTSLLVVEKIRKFLRKVPGDEEERGCQPLKLTESIEVDNIVFTYPFASKETLCGISLRLQKGMCVAIVGCNGAGKSTLINLLLRLYEPSAGKILLDGRNAREFEILDYRNSFSVLFQQFQLYATSVAKNIAMGSTCDHKRAFLALQKVGLSELICSNDSNSSGLDQFIGRDFDTNGLLLSGGQSQLLACARLYYANRDIIILDEPSSALDPIAENQFNIRIRELAKNHAVIVVSHRLTTVKMSDYIYMMDEGKIIEEGTHTELLAQKGEYWKMWEIQAEKYRIGVT